MKNYNGRPSKKFGRSANHMGASRSQSGLPNYRYRPDFRSPNQRRRSSSGYGLSGMPRSKRKRR